MAGRDHLRRKQPCDGLTSIGKRADAAAVLSSPKVSEAEIESFAKMATVSEDVLRTIGMNRSWLKNYSVVGVHWAAYNLHDPALIAATHAELVRLHGEGAIRPFIGRRVPMAEAPQALADLGGRRTVGKVVVLPDA